MNKEDSADSSDEDAKDSKTASDNDVKLARRNDKADALLSGARRQVPGTSSGIGRV